MKLHFRLLAALFALSALIQFQVEGLWASSSCSVEMEMPVPAGSEISDHTESHLASCSTGESGHSREQDGKKPHGPDCSLMLVDAASCMGVAALLPSSAKPDSGPVEDELPLASSDHAKDLLLAVSLLRPPQA